MKATAWMNVRRILRAIANKSFFLPLPFLSLFQALFSSVCEAEMQVNSHLRMLI